jgi:hypothetical protein
MLELEMQKLTAAITALTEELRSAKVGNELPTEKETPTNPDKPRQKKPKVTQEEVEALVEAATPVENTECTDQPLMDNIPEGRPDITETSLKTMALEIVRADSSARALILAILAEHGAKTVTQLDHKHHHEVHGRFLSLAYDIAKNGEVTQ